MELLDPDIAAPGIWGSASGQERPDRRREELPLLMCDRDNAVQSAKTTQTVLTSVIVRRPPSRANSRVTCGQAKGSGLRRLACPEGADRQTQISSRR
jgi:hypothetical protein